MRSVQSAAFVVLAVAFSGTACGADTQTYRFTGEEFSYSFNCGQCGNAPYEYRARVEGTFEVELDIALGTGILTGLNAWLVDRQGAYPVGAGWDEWEWRAVGPDREFLPAASRHGDWYRPPFDGTFALAAEHPLAPDYSSGGLLGPNFPEPEDDALFLANTGLVPTSDGRGFRSVSTFQIAMRDGKAIFSYYIPIDDAVETILGATAVQVVPEPESIIIVVGVAGMLYVATCVPRRGL